MGDWNSFLEAERLAMEADQRNLPIGWERFRNIMAYIFWPAVIVLIALGLNFIPYLGGAI
jgi:hypothetical protein